MWLRCRVVYINVGVVPTLLRILFFDYLLFVHQFLSFLLNASIVWSKVDRSITKQTLVLTVYHKTIGTKLCEGIVFLGVFQFCLFYLLN